MEKTLAENVKKIHNWSNGFGLYLTKECKILKWNNKTYVKIKVIKDRDEERIVIERLKV